MSSFPFIIVIYLTLGEKFVNRRNAFVIKNIFRVTSYANMSAVTAHIGKGYPRSGSLCIAYEPSGPSPKSGDGVNTTII